MENRPTPLDKLYEWESKTPEKVFMRQPLDGKYIDFTWKEAAQEVRKMAAALISLNLPPESKIALVSKNCAHWLISDLAIMMAGHVSVPIYPNVGSYTLNYVLLHSEAKLLLVGKLDNWDGMKEGVPEGVQTVAFPLHGPKELTSWESFVSKVSPLEGTPNRKLDDMMTIIYTSGTTGAPKGVVHNFSSIVFAVTEAFKIVELKPNGRAFSYLPLSHIAERMLIAMGVLYSGATVYFAESLDTFVENLKFASPTVFLGVPRIWSKFRSGILEKMPEKKLARLLKIPLLGAFVRNKIKKGLGLDQCIYYFTGAAPMPASIMEWYAKLGINIQEVYAMTENSAYSHFTRKEDIRPGFAGQALPGVEVKFSEEGEILVKSEANMVGYYKEKEMTAKTLEGGYLHTGDKGEVDKEGFLKITGRVKDIFKTEKGKYVAPAPIELKLSKNEYIEQVCVVGSGLPQPLALVVLSEQGYTGSRTEIAESLENTLKDVNKVLEKHEKLKRLVCVKEPWTPENDMLTPTLKIKRSPLEKKYSDEIKGWYDSLKEVVFES